MTTRDKLNKVLLHLADHGKIELGTPESKMLCQIAAEFDAFALKLHYLEKEASDMRWERDGRLGYLMDGR